MQKKSFFFRNKKKKIVEEIPFDQKTKTCGGTWKQSCHFQWSAAEELGVPFFFPQNFWKNCSYFYIRDENNFIFSETLVYDWRENLKLLRASQAKRIRRYSNPWKINNHFFFPFFYFFLWLYKFWKNCSYFYTRDENNFIVSETLVHDWWKNLKLLWASWEKHIRSYSKSVKNQSPHFFIFFFHLPVFTPKILEELLVLLYPGWE